MANREETPKASLIAQFPRVNKGELSDIGAVRDPEKPHGFTVEAPPESHSFHRGHDCDD